MKAVAAILAIALAALCAGSIVVPASADVTGLEVVTDEGGETLSPTSLTPVVVSCPSGKEAISGGWNNPSQSQVVITTDSPFQDTELGWIVTFRNVSGSSATRGDVYAVCADT